MKEQEGYVAIPNEVFEQLAKFRIPGECRQVLDVILRKTYGWNKKEDWISNSQFVELTGMKKGNVSRSLSKMITAGIVIKSDNKYGLNEDFSGWNEFKSLVIKSDNKVIKKETSVIKSDNDLLSKVRDTTNNTNTITTTIIEDHRYLQLWKEIRHTTLRTKLPENIQSAERLERLLGFEGLCEVISALRVIHADPYSGRDMKMLGNYIQLEKNLEKVESYMQAKADQGAYEAKFNPKKGMVSV